MMMNLSKTISMRVGLFFSIFAALISGLEMAFNVYALPLKETFNYTQTQVEIIASTSALGVGLSFLEPLCTWLLGFKVTCVILLIGLPVASGLFSLTAYYSEFFHSWPSMVATIHLLISVMTSCGYLSITKVCLGIFPTEHTGKLVGLYMAFVGLGKIYFAGVFELFFDGNLAGFFLSISALSAVIYGTCFWCLYPFAEAQENQSEPEHDDSVKIYSETQSVDTSIRDLLRSPFFQTILWTSVNYFACGTACIANISLFAQSVGLANPLQTVYICAVVINIVRLSNGAILDKFTSLWCGLTLLFVSYITFIAAMIFSMCLPEKSTILYVSALISVGMALGSVTPISVILVRYGRRHYSTVTSCFYAMQCISQTLLHIMIAYFYDAEIRQIGLNGTTCYGRNCFYWSCLVMLVITLVIAVIQGLNFCFCA